MWAAFTPTAPTAFTTAGAYTYNIPDGCRFIDVILLGAGSGGNAGGAGFVAGNGGQPGTWQVVTVERGVDIPWSIKQITGLVGAGGTQGISGGAAPSSGGATTATASGWAGLSAAGGVFVNSGGQVGKAPSPATQSLNGQTYSPGTHGMGGAGRAHRGMGCEALQCAGVWQGIGVAVQAGRQARTGMGTGCGGVPRRVAAAGRPPRRTPGCPRVGTPTPVCDDRTVMRVRPPMRTHPPFFESQ
ncbi:glycine-rich domain-containing protein [Mycobacterium avium]|uniref:glycine-rich domain-containing protein n=1 Tax=Mycobacterium avium TaxID=1764 RepID=UPI003FEE17BB